MNWLLRTLLTNVPSGLANTLAWSMLVVVAVLLTTGIVLVYIYYRKNKKLQAAQTVTPA